MAEGLWEEGRGGGAAVGKGREQLLIHPPEATALQSTEQPRLYRVREALRRSV